MAVLTVKYDLLVEQMTLKAGWKCVSTEHGEQCVMTTGMLWMAMSFASSWDFNLQVLHSQFCNICVIHWGYTSVWFGLGQTGSHHNMQGLVIIPISMQLP